MAFLSLALVASSGLLMRQTVRHVTCMTPRHRAAGSSWQLLMCDAAETELPEVRWVEIAQQDSEPDEGATASRCHAQHRSIAQLACCHRMP